MWYSSIYVRKYVYFFIFGENGLPFYWERSQHGLLQKRGLVPNPSLAVAALHLCAQTCKEIFSDDCKSGVRASVHSLNCAIYHVFRYGGLYSPGWKLNHVSPVPTQLSMISQKQAKAG